MVRVRGAGGGRVSIAGVACYRPGDRPHLFYALRTYRRRKGEVKGFTWIDYRDLIITVHQHLAVPLIWCWDNLNVHLAPQLADFAAENKDWLRIYRLPAYAPDMNPVEGIWSLLNGPWPTSPPLTWTACSGSSSASSRRSSTGPT